MKMNVIIETGLNYYYNDLCQKDDCTSEITCCENSCDGSSQDEGDE